MMRSRTIATWVGLLVLLSAGGLAGIQRLYEVQYPDIGYSTRPLEDPVALLQASIEGGEAELEFVPVRGYLSSLLRELKIDAASQLLVYSKTSLQVQYISPETPRAIYFGDDVYVAWEQGGEFIEIASMDPNLGPVFYTLAQDAADPRFDRQLETCLRCHDSYSLTGGGVPRFILGSGLIDGAGQLVSHEGWILTTDQTPIRRRWGGWYVTGTHGEQEHLGNVVIRDPNELETLDLSATGNLTDLDTLIDTEPYVTRHSDIVALMVVEHQVRVQNLITRVNYDVRTALARDPLDVEVIARAAEPLVEAMLFVGEAGLSAEIRGRSGFAMQFAEAGVSDSEGRSLRDLDLSQRLFRYPCSYLIYSAAFDGLPEPVRDYVYRRMREVLRGEDATEPFAHLSAADREAILEILADTKPDFAAGL